VATGYTDNIIQTRGGTYATHSQGLGVRHDSHQTPLNQLQNNVSGVRCLHKGCRGTGSSAVTNPWKKQGPDYESKI
jgi:hypothetical protein